MYICCDYGVYHICLKNNDLNIKIHKKLTMVVKDLVSFEVKWE